MPPEIINSKRNEILDYSKADRWSITLIALDILFGHLARGNPFYPLKRGRRVFCDQKDYEDDDLAYFFSRHTPAIVQKDCSKRILDLFHETLSKVFGFRFSRVPHVGTKLNDTPNRTTSNKPLCDRSHHVGRLTNATPETLQFGEFFSFYQSASGIDETAT